MYSGSKVSVDALIIGPKLLCPAMIGAAGEVFVGGADSEVTAESLLGARAGAPGLSNSGYLFRVRFACTSFHMMRVES